MPGNQCNESGSAAVAALFKGNKIWRANAGDSRCIIGSVGEKKVICFLMFSPTEKFSD